MAAVEKSRYFDVGDGFNPKLEVGPEDILTQTYEAQSWSKSGGGGIRFRFTGSGPRALLDSEVLLRIPIKATFTNLQTDPLTVSRGRAQAGRNNATAIRFNGFWKAGNKNLYWKY